MVSKKFRLWEDGKYLRDMQFHHAEEDKLAAELLEKLQAEGKFPKDTCTVTVEVSIKYSVLKTAEQMATETESFSKVYTFKTKAKVGETELTSQKIDVECVEGALIKTPKMEKKK